MATPERRSGIAGISVVVIAAVHQVECWLCTTQNPARCKTWKGTPNSRNSFTLSP
jgi:hypothetical protein